MPPPSLRALPHVKGASISHLAFFFFPSICGPPNGLCLVPVSRNFHTCACTSSSLPCPPSLSFLSLLSPCSHSLSSLRTCSLCATLALHHFCRKPECQRAATFPSSCLLLFLGLVQLGTLVYVGCRLSVNRSSSVVTCPSGAKSALTCMRQACADCSRALMLYLALFWMHACMCGGLVL